MRAIMAQVIMAGGVQEAFVVAGGAAVFADPGERPLDDPSVGRDLWA
jgi:hypothetical protein